jgi:hypothetical protein
MLWSGVPVVLSPWIIIIIAVVLHRDPTSYPY